MPSVKEISHRLYILFHINFIFHVNLYKREHWFIGPLQCLYAHWEVAVTPAIKYQNLVVHPCSINSIYVPIAWAL